MADRLPPGGAASAAFGRAVGQLEASLRGAGSGVGVAGRGGDCFSTLGAGLEERLRCAATGA